MSNLERNPSPESFDRIQLTLLRSEIDQPPKSAVKKELAMIEQTLSPQMLLQAKEVFDRLRSTGEALRFDNALILTVNLLGTIENSNIVLLKQPEFRIKKKRIAFARFSDMNSGMELVSEALRHAESEKAGEFYTEIMQAKEEVIDSLNPDPLTQVDLHLDFGSFHQKVRRFAELLKKDPSGFSVVDAVVEGIASRGSLSVSSFRVQEWVLAGAQIASQIYKTIYPQAEVLLRPSA